MSNSNSGRPYLVEVSRLVNEIENGNAYDISDCKYVTGVSEYGEGFYNSHSDYVIRKINGELYRFDYTADGSVDNAETIIVVKYSDIRIIDQSPTGLYEKKSNNLLEL